MRRAREHANLHLRRRLRADAGGQLCLGTVPADPGFQNTPAGAWTLGQGATIDPTAAGYLDPGELTLSRAASCALGGGAHQSITMPTVAQSEPFALTLVSNADCTTKGGPNCPAMSVDVVINDGALSYDEPADPYISHTGCLGERAYGGTIDLAIRPQIGECSTMDGDAIVDHVQIAPSSTCPMPGTLPDGDFDDALDTWGASSVPSAGFTPVAEIAPGLGTAGSAAAHLSAPGCGEATAGELISPPLSLPNLALQVRFKGTAGASARVLLDNTTLAVLTGTGAEVSSNIRLLESNKGMTQLLPAVTDYTQVQICLDPTMSGRIAEVLLTLAGNRRPCTPSTTETAWFDDFAVTTSASCPTQ